jgi:alpha-glucoside transport system substrate-binding protein
MGVVADTTGQVGGDGRSEAAKGLAMTSDTEESKEARARRGSGDDGRSRRHLNPVEWIASAVVGLLVTAAWGWMSDSLGLWIRRAVPWLVLGAVTAAIAWWRWPVSRRVAAALLAVWVGMAAALVFFSGDSAAALDDCERTVDDDAIEVMVIWEGDEKDSFCQLVGSYGGQVAVTSVGPEIGTALDRRLADGDPPDVAIVAQPSLVRKSERDDELCPLRSEVAERFPTEWNGLVSEQVLGGGQASLFGAPVKGTNKSLLWYDADQIDDIDSEWTYDELLAWVRANVDNPAFDAPLSIPAGDQWPLTDLFENLLAGNAPAVYDALAGGKPIIWDTPEVRGALTTTLTDLAELLAIDGAFPGGPEGAGTTSWRDLPAQVTNDKAGLVFGPSFLKEQFDRLARPVAATPVSFPMLPGGRRPLVVAGDFAVVLEPAGSGECSGALAAQAFVDWLTDTEAITRWGRLDRGYLTPNNLSPLRPDADPQPPPDEGVRSILTGALNKPPAGGLHFDLSDDQFGAAAEGDARAIWDTFDRFFHAVTGGAVSTECAVDQAMVEIEAEYKGESPVRLPCS